MRASVMTTVLETTILMTLEMRMTERTVLVVTPRWSPSMLPSRPSSTGSWKRWDKRWTIYQNMKLLQFKHKVRNTNRLASMGSEESEESARELHEQQKKLVLEEDNVRNVDTKLARMQKKRGNREGENERFVFPAGL